MCTSLPPRRFYSPGVLAALRDHAAAGGLEPASSWDTSALLYGLAWLNYDWRDGLVLAREGGGGGGRGYAGGGAAAMPPPPRSPALAVDLVGLLADVVVRKVGGFGSDGNGAAVTAAAWVPVANGPWLYAYEAANLIVQSQRCRTTVP